MKKLKVSVIGVGHLGKIHIKLLSQNNSVELVGVYDAYFPTNAELIATSLNDNTLIMNSLEEAIAKSDALFVVASTTEHFKIASEILTNNKHVFIEKPVCSNIKQAKELAKIAKKHPNLKVQIGHIERFNPAVVATIAKLQNIELPAHIPNTQISPAYHKLWSEGLKKANRPKFIEAHRLTQFSNRSTDVSVIHDLMIHDIDLALWLVKSPVKQIDANAVSIITKHNDLANARLKFENGTVANLTASRISVKSMRKFRMFGKGYYTSADLAGGGVELINIDKLANITHNQPAIQSLNALATEQQAFIDCINNDTLPICTLKDGIVALEIAEEIARIINT